jgi:hypothetical protein
MNEANNFLPDFIKKFNERFGLFTDNIKSVFRELEEKNVDFVLSRRFERTVSNGGTIKYMNRYYMTYSKEVAVPYKKGTKVNLFIINFNAFQLCCKSNQYKERLLYTQMGRYSRTHFR